MTDEPIYGDPMYKISETVGPGKVTINIDIQDFERFNEMIEKTKKGGYLQFVKTKEGRVVRVNIRNTDKLNPVKRL